MSQSGKIRYRKVPFTGSPSAWTTVDPVVVGEASAIIDVSGLNLDFGDKLEVEGLPDWSRTRSFLKIPPAPVWDTALSAVSPPATGQSLDVALSPRVTGTAPLTYTLTGASPGVSLAGSTLTLDATGLSAGAPLSGTVTVSDGFGQSAASAFALAVAVAAASAAPGPILTIDGTDQTILTIDGTEDTILYVEAA